WNTNSLIPIYFFVSRAISGWSCSSHVILENGDIGWMGVPVFKYMSWPSSSSLILLAQSRLRLSAHVIHFVIGSSSLFIAITLCMALLNEMNDHASAAIPDFCITFPIHNNTASKISTGSSSAVKKFGVWSG